MWRPFSLRDCLFSCRGKGSEIAVPGELVRCQGSTQCHIVHRSKTTIRQPRPCALESIRHNGERQQIPLNCSNDLSTRSRSLRRCAQSSTKFLPFAIKTYIFYISPRSEEHTSELQSR